MNMVNKQEAKAMSTAITLENNPNDTSWKQRTLAYRTGYVNRVNGLSRAAQPYGKNTTVAAHWIMGWRKADLDVNKVV